MLHSLFLLQTGEEKKPTKNFQYFPVFWGTFKVIFVIGISDMLIGVTT